jgi:hypothetical protein
MTELSRRIRFTVCVEGMAWRGEGKGMGKRGKCVCCEDGGDDE